MKRKKSLRERVEYAQRRERAAKRRLKYLDEERRRLERENASALFWMRVLASLVGDDFVVTPEQQAYGNEREFLAEMLPDGSVHVILAELLPEAERG